MFGEILVVRFDVGVFAHPLGVTWVVRIEEVISRICDELSIDNLLSRCLG